MSTRLPENAPGYKNHLSIYYMKYKCSNCKREFDISIPKGTPAKKHILNPCPNCGCEKLFLKGVS